MISTDEGKFMRLVSQQHGIYKAWQSKSQNIAEQIVIQENNRSMKTFFFPFTTCYFVIKMPFNGKYDFVLIRYLTHCEIKESYFDGTYMCVS